MEITPLTVLATVAIALLVLFTSGIGYLTFIEWRDRRRQKRDEKLR